MVTTACGIGSSDGMNEKSRGVHLLHLTAADFMARDTSKSGVQPGFRGRYMLDNAALSNSRQHGSRARQRECG